MQEVSRDELARACGGGPVWEATKKWGNRALWAADIASAGYEGVTAGQKEYQRSGSAGRATVAGGTAAAKELAPAAAWSAASYLGLINPYTLGAYAFAKVMEPTPAY